MVVMTNGVVLTLATGMNMKKIREVVLLLQQMVTEEIMKEEEASEVGVEDLEAGEGSEVDVVDTKMAVVVMEAATVASVVEWEDHEVDADSEGKVHVGISEGDQACIRASDSHTLNISSSKKKLITSCECDDKSGYMCIVTLRCVSICCTTY